MVVQVQGGKPGPTIENPQQAHFVHFYRCMAANGNQISANWMLGNQRNKEVLYKFFLLLESNHTIGTGALHPQENETQLMDHT